MFCSAKLGKAHSEAVMNYHYYCVADACCWSTLAAQEMALLHS